MNNLKERAVEWILSLLEGVGVPSVLPWSFRKIRSLFSGEPERYLQFLVRMSKHEEWLPRFFAGHEFHTVYRQHPGKVVDRLGELSGDEREIIREGAATSWSKLMQRDFNEVFQVIRDMADSDQFERRYTAALAPVHYYDDHASQRERERIFQFWESFEDDERQGLANLVDSQIKQKRSRPS